MEIIRFIPLFCKNWILSLLAKRHKNMIYNGPTYKKYLEIIKKVKMFTKGVTFKTNFFSLIIYKIVILLNYNKK